MQKEHQPQPGGGPAPGVALRRDWKVSELESVRMHFSSKLESVTIGKCRNWKVSELESIRIGKCQN